MITEEQAMRLLIEANPLADLSTGDLKGDLSATHRAVSSERSREMTRLQPRHADTRQAARPGRLIWVAFTLVAVFVAGLMLLPATERPVADSEYAADQAGPLGVFERIRGRIVFRDGSRLVGVDADDPDSVDVVELPPEILDTELMVAGWSADGSELALTSEGRGTYVMDRTGLAVQVSPAGGCCNFVTSAWLSPDGTEILEVRERGALQVIDLDSAVVTRRIELDQEFDAVSSPVWSPDGERVAFVSRREALAIVDLSAGATRQLVEAGPFDVIRQIGWSPDGSRLLVVALDEPFPGGQSQNPLVDPWRSALYLVDISDGESHRIAEGYYVVAAWSPDGARIAAIDYHPNGRDLVVMDADGSGLRVLFSGAGGLFTGVAWHPVP